MDRLLHLNQFSCSRIESGTLRTAFVIQEQNGGNTQIERNEDDGLFQNLVSVEPAPLFLRREVFYAE